MKFKFFFFLLFRYLFSSWAYKQKLRQGFALSALIPMIGVGVGVFAFVVVLGVMSGFVTNLKAEIIQFTPHVQITSKDTAHEIPENQNLFKEITEIVPQQIIGITNFQTGDAILQVDGQATLITIEGVNPKKIDDVLDLDSFLVIGSGLNLLDKKVEVIDKSNQSQTLELPSAVIGRELALQMSLSVGNVATLVSILFDEGFAPVQMPIVISGIYDTGRLYLDSKMIYISIQNANKFFTSPKQWTGLELKLKDPFNPDEVVHKLNQSLNPQNLKAQAWTVKNTALLKALFLEHLGMITVMTMIILVGCFSITISLLLSLHRKTRELAILRGLGLTQKDLSRLYLSQGFIIGTIGVVIGLFFGLITLYLVHNFHVPILSDAYTGDPLPVQINCFDIIFVSIGSICLATLAAFWPAYEVRRLNVVDVLAIRQ